MGAHRLLRCIPSIRLIRGDGQAGIVNQRRTSLRDFERFISILATASANMLNKSDVARDVGVSVKAIGDRLSVLQASGKIHLLLPRRHPVGNRLHLERFVCGRERHQHCRMAQLYYDMRNA